MTLTEALAPYTIKGADSGLPITSDRVSVEYDVVAGKSRFSKLVLEVGDDLFVTITKSFIAGQPVVLEVEGGPDHRLGGSVSLTPEVAEDLAVCLAWAARQEDAQL